MIQQYLAELSKIKLLTKAEEIQLWEEYKLRDSKEARQRIIESYQPLVYKITSRLTNNEELFFDLIQEGTVGLIEAVECFDLKYEVKFSTYAQHRIRGRMIDFLRRQRQAQDSLEAALHEEEFSALIAKIVDVQVNVEDEVALKMISNQVNSAISRLNSKERKIITDIYLLDKEPLVSAQEMNISLSYLYKLQKKALQRLRGMLSKIRAEIKTSGGGFLT
ncbi:MAG: sigma-70 family RNA polymerase sigma factor [Firmicutes bacterium]|nr:sigma-70 family RNA polymerase sigma factor [Bacillota bacterium]